MKNIFKKKYIAFIISYIIIIGFAIGILFSQKPQNNYDINPTTTLGPYDNGDDYSLIDKIDDETGLDIDPDTMSFLISKKKQAVKIVNTSDYSLIDTDFDNILKSNKNELIINTSEFLQNVEITKPLKINTRSQFVEPSEIKGYNFIVMEYHQPVKAFESMNSYYRVYLNDEYVGNTNKGPWTEHYKFFAYNLDIGVEYKIKMERMVADDTSDDYSPAVLNIYHPDEYLEDVRLINERDDAVIFILLVWRKTGKVYECVVRTEENGEKYLTRDGTIWKYIQQYYLD